MAGGRARKSDTAPPLSPPDRTANVGGGIDPDVQDHQTRLWQPNRIELVGGGYHVSFAAKCLG
jgi:hypothetical protein